MTPGARVAAAIGILDQMDAGMAAEQALTRWARASRFAGSGDRAAVRDYVFSVLRCKRMAAALGGGTSGRALMIGLLRLSGSDPDGFFTGEGHAPDPLSTEESDAPEPPEDQGVQWNMPDWLIPEFSRSLGASADEAARVMTSRAPVTLRVNSRLSDPGEVTAALTSEGVQVEPVPGFLKALRVTRGERRLRNTKAWETGLFELQDAASQAVVSELPVGERCLDFCAGGGGKALAMAADPARRVFAHDANPQRMRDLPARAARAQADITQLNREQLTAKAPYDLVLCDAPCSGSGAWRRAPEGKWSLTPRRLQELQSLQLSILNEAAGLVAEDGWLVYATCSVLTAENEDTVARFLNENPAWTCSVAKRFNLSQENDGFFAAHLTR
ncbi:RsmB/NOP family class I SAM-dependent RNA methyltransferase [uncultured Roseobacter sp.]|uniref:RsmB/NOP family class I SAM-dependent RNA methyltransferase n=1 Tax=uncultured Roseobacter sp. TaxID=114847 RepID=UPI00261AD320|nr:RsmB/NOP family class I SAM-dependent RNA methyltransferase [uncultured Roseobacter sp.]